MFQHQGIWLPDGEKHFPEWMTKNGELVDGRGTYQIKKWRACIPHIKNWRVAVDVGAHVGLWSMQLAKRFERVLAFEPVDDFRECFWKNIPRPATDDMNAAIVCHSCALGAVAGRVRMTIPLMARGIDSGGTHVDSTATDGAIELRTLDSFGFADVDFIKIDCEGYEHQVLHGAVETLKRCKPCVIVEQKPHKLGPNFGIKGTPGVDYLRSLGAVVRKEIGGDWILSWD